MMTYHKMNKNIFLYCVITFLFLANLSYSETVKAKTNFSYNMCSDIAFYPNNLIKILTAKQYFIIEANIDKVIEYRLLKISQQVQIEINKQSIPNIEITKKGNNLIIFYKNALDSTKILNIIQNLPRSILNNAELKNELINNQPQMTLTLPNLNIAKELHSKSEDIIKDIFKVNHIQAITIPLSNNKFFIISLKNDQIDLESYFQNIGKVTFHLVDNKENFDNPLSSSVISLPFMFNPSERLPIYKNALMDGQSITNATAKFSQDIQQYSINVEFDITGTKLLKDIARQNISKKMAMIIDNKIIFAPLITEPVDYGKVRINGNISSQQAKAIANLLSLNYIPITFKVTETDTFNILSK